MLAAQWSQCPVFGINDNDSFEPPADGRAYIVVQYPINRAEQLTFGSPGSNVWREEGTFRLVLHTPRGSGKVQALSWSDTLTALYRGKGLASGIVTWAPTSLVFDESNEDGNYYVSSFSVPYWHDYFG